MLYDSEVLLRSDSLRHVTDLSFPPFLGELTANAPSTTRINPKEDSAAVTAPQTATTTTGFVDKQSHTARQPATAQSGPQSNTSAQQVTATSPNNMLSTTQESVRTSPKTTNQPNKTAQLGQNTASTTVQSSRTGKK